MKLGILRLVKVRKAKVLTPLRDDSHKCSCVLCAVLQACSNALFQSSHLLVSTARVVHSFTLKFVLNVTIQRQNM